MKKSIVEQLRDRFPQENFRAERHPDSWNWQWRGKSMLVRAYSQLTPQHDCDDETAVIVYLDEDQRMIGSGGIIF